MAKNISTHSTRLRKNNANHKGIHAKTRHSKSKTSKYYKKTYIGQGR
jgi:hypothetical protein